MKTLTAKQLQDMQQRQDDLTVINVLPEDEFRAMHIPGSHNIPAGGTDFARRVEQAAGSKDKPVVVYCGSTTCDASPKAARRLEDAGFTNVYDFESGVEGWKQAGLPIEGVMAGAQGSH